MMASTRKNDVVQKPLNLRASSSFKSKLPQSRNRTSDSVSGRVRVAVRLRPRHAEEMQGDADFGDCVELQPELKRLKLRKNNWDSDTYEFDEVLTEAASQKRVYEVVAKPVVESVLEGYNGTVMAYGQTGTGKSYTLGQLGDEDTSTRGIMVRSMEELLANISPQTDSVLVSYLQLYMETIQDLLNPSNDNSIAEDQKSGDVSLPGATAVEVSDQQSFVELLRLSEAHRYAANTELNSESSRSHAILMIHVQRSIAVHEDDYSADNGNLPPKRNNYRPPVLRKSKLVIVDLANSERVLKSGSEGHMLEEAKFINLSLSSLGKCINALAEYSAHVPVRDSKLTRLLKDSFGGTSRTSLVVTVGPSPLHRGETASTILFGQRAMKVENMLGLNKEFDYKSLSKRLEIQLDKLIAENERQKKAYDDDLKRIRLEAEERISETKRKFEDALKEEKSKCQMEYMESIKNLEEKWATKQQKQVNNGFVREADDISELNNLLRNEIHLRKVAEEELTNLKDKLTSITSTELAMESVNLVNPQKALEEESYRKKKLEEVMVLQSQLSQLTERCPPERVGRGTDLSSLDCLSPLKHLQPRDGRNADRASIATLHEQVGLHKILSLLKSQDAGVRIHALKVVANMASEEANQEKIVEAGGLTSLLWLLRTYEDETIRRIAAGAVANLAMNEANQDLILSQGGVCLLAMTAADANDPQTLRMVAGAIANLCGNEKLQTRLRSEGGIKALLGMVKSRHPDVISQVARGIANFAKFESRVSTPGRTTRRSLLVEDGAMPWIIQNANSEASIIRRHVELALCYLAENEANAGDLINGGGLWELLRISRYCSREDIRALACRTLTTTPTFYNEIQRLRIEL